MIALIKAKLQDLITEGEIELNDGRLSWYYTETIIEPDELYSISCEQADILRGAGYESENSWADNDSCGFDIVVVKPFCQWLKEYPMKG